MVGFEDKKGGILSRGWRGCVTQKTFESSSPHFTLSLTIAPENKSEVFVKNLLELLVGSVIKSQNIK